MKVRICAVGILFFACVTIGCSSTPQKWYKSGGTAAMYERDKSDCDDQLLAGDPGGMVKQYTFESCMEYKGWVLLDSPAM